MRTHHRSLPSLLFLFVALILALPTPAEAQYFGRNKVQWENFDFKVLKTEHFDIYYYEESEPVIEDVARMAERWYTRLSRVFDHEFSRKPLVIYASHPDFQQTTTTQGQIGEGTGGFTDLFMNRVVLPLTGSYADNDHVLGHEMVHVFQFDVANKFSGGERKFQLMRMPLWVIEGLAEYLSQGSLDPQTAMWVRDAAIRDQLPTLERMTREFQYNPYQFGQAFWAYIGGRWGDRAVMEVFLASGFIGMEGAAQRVLGVGSEQLVADWHAAARSLYEPVISTRWGPDRLGDPLIQDSGRRDIDVSPALSPDGRYVAFLSSRELFSIDLYIADARTGEVVDKLVSSAGSPHFDALRFIDSAGSWSPDGRQFAFIITEKGDNRIGIADVEGRRISNRFSLPGIEAILQVAWSPDGRRLAVAGMKNGVSDLYLWDLQSEQLTQVTDDRHADLQPAWSPDGRRIAISSDRGPGTDFTALTYARPRISIVDLDTGRIQTLDIFSDAKHINPQFTPDGTGLYFVADPMGVADIFRYGLDSGRVDRISNVATGVTGITDLSPALSVAARTGDAIFTLFTGGRWAMYRVSESDLEGVAVPQERLANDVRRAAFLPPPVNPDDPPAAAQVASYLDEPNAGLLPLDTDFESTGYDSGLRLAYVGPPTIGGSFGSDWSGAYGSFSALFTDVLGRHQVGVTLQGGGGSSSFGNLFGGEAYYLNQSRRFQWGAAVTHLPYTTGVGRGWTTEVIEVDGQPTQADVLQTVIERTTIDEVMALTRYPFGTTRRWEFNAGFTNLGYSAELQSDYFVNGGYLGSDTDDISLPSISYSKGQTAFVGDSSVFGFISPIMGTRYRLQGEAYTGDLTFQTGLVDWRRYMFARPVTFAVRGLFYGRYGDDAEDQRISPLYVGRSTLVRGYESDSFSIDECTAPPGSGACPEFDRLIGSKMAHASAEVRVPLFGFEGYGLFELPYLPTELVAFADMGAAWTENEDVTWEYQTDTTERVPVFSAGIAARILLGGYLPIQFYYAFPFQRPQEDGGVFGFAITPGW